MLIPDRERVTCPHCSKQYVWQIKLASRQISCKVCGTEFVIPDQPGQGRPVQTAEDDSLYELARDPDEERELPPAYQPPSVPPANEPAPPPAESANTTDTINSADVPDSDEPEGHISEAAKAARREEQRIAAAEKEAARTWREYKWLYIVLALLCLFAIIYWAIYQFSNAMEDGLHNTMLQNHTHVIAASDPPERGEPS